MYSGIILMIQILIIQKLQAVARERYKKWSKEGEDQTIRARLGFQISTEKREKLREENGLEKQPNDWAKGNFYFWVWHLSSWRKDNLQEVQKDIED